MVELLTWEQALEAMRQGKHVQRAHQSPMTDIQLYMDYDTEKVLICSHADDLDGKPPHHTVLDAYSKCDDWVIVKPMDLGVLKVTGFSLDRDVTRRNDGSDFARGDVTRHLFIETPSGTVWKVKAPEGLVEEIVKYWQDHNNDFDSTAVKMVWPAARRSVRRRAPAPVEEP